MSLIQIHPSQWQDAGSSAQTGSNDSNDITNDVNLAIQSLNNALNAVGFMTNAKNFVTVMEEFGAGMEAALACISVDLVVVGSGVTAASAAFSRLDATLASTFAQMEKQLTYFTNTASSVTLGTPTEAEKNALLSLLGEGNPHSYDPGIHLSFPKSSVATDAAVAGGAAAVLLLLGLLVIA